MMRLQALLIAGLGVLAAGSWATDSEPNDGKIRLNGHPVERRIRSRAEFIEKLNGWLSEWERGSIPLRTVTRNVKDHCEVFYPHYLESIPYAETAKSTEKQIAQNLIRHYQSVASPAGNQEFLDRIRDEYRHHFMEE